MRKVYVDHNATTPIHPEVLDAMLPFLKDMYGNASSIHWAGRGCRKALDTAREQVAEFLGVHPLEIVFTGSGSEANNYAIKGSSRTLKKKGSHIIASTVEHPAVLEPLKYLEKRDGARVTYLPVDDKGIISLDELKEAITDDTILITMMYGNNETGTVFPINEIANIAKERGIRVHCDAIQAAGKIPLKPEKMNVDMLSISGHKLYAPKGVGALYIKKGVKADRLIHGGHQERGRRAGTENIAGIVALGKACEIAARDLDAEAEHCAKLRDKLQKGLFERIEEVKLNGHPSERLPNTLNASFKYIEGEAILINLDMQGIAASSGSACTSGSLDPSHVLIAMGIPHEIAHGSIRFSMGRDNTEEDIDYILDEVPPIIEKLRGYSPLWDNKKREKAAQTT